MDGLSSLWSVFIALFVWGLIAAVLHLRLDRALPNRDPLLLPAAMFLCGWGLQILVRLSPETALRQTLWLFLVGGMLMVFLQLPRDLEWLRKYRYLWLGAALLAVAATLFFGIGAGPDSPRLWLGLDGIFFQPSEFLRWIFPVFAAFTLAPPDAQTATPRKRKNSLPVLLFGAAGVLLHILQQDLGAAVLLIAAMVLILYLAYRKTAILLLGAAAVLGILGFGYAFSGTIRDRLATWWNPWLDPSNTSYQVVQSLISVAAGGLIGRGPGLGTPQLVPVAYSDFIFSALSEEYGVLGAVGCLTVIAVLVLRGLRIAVRSADPASRLIAGSPQRAAGMPIDPDHRRRIAAAAAHRSHPALDELRRLLAAGEHDHARVPAHPLGQGARGGGSPAGSSAPGPLRGIFDRLRRGGRERGLVGNLPRARAAHPHR